ncbi:polysaccharide deacetylase family protein [uncultured Sulfitobacter sp.]|uniref:polysaccharide deacetylase family protein n=1 Tax=Sulfitobacter sp. SH22 TaxID=3421172 RepID=UPI0025DE3E53|nr:polysaccharide deacetylase family protein [uncultured Sulfitobacter sp.]
MKIDWSPLNSELALWRAEQRPLPIWWRDDDAVEPTPALDRLTALANTLGLPVHAAVIPKLAQPSLAKFCADQDQVIPLVHGWQHVSHAPEGHKKAEFGHPREAALGDAGRAIDRMKLLFADHFLPIFVPPWNRLDSALLPDLAALGYVGVSTYLPRKNTWAAPGLAQINTHIDPIFWRGTRGLAPTDELVAHMVKLLQDRRQGITDATEPMGFLTHHLVHDEDIWDFSQSCLTTLLDGGATPADLSRPEKDTPHEQT